MEFEAIDMKNLGKYLVDNKDEAAEKARRSWVVQIGKRLPDCCLPKALVDRVRALVCFRLCLCRLLSWTHAYAYALLNRS